MVPWHTLVHHQQVLVSTGAKRDRSSSPSSSSCPWCPWGNVAVLGMGGNALGYTITKASPATRLHVVEIEPSVYAMCAMQGAVPSASHTTTYHIVSMEAFFADPSKYERPLDVIILDCFDPHQATMAHGHTILALCKTAMNTERSLLIVNMHAAPTEENLQVFYTVFGHAAVHAMTISGCVQSLVLCVVPSRSEVLPAVTAITARQWTQLGGTRRFQRKHRLRQRAKTFRSIRRPHGYFDNRR